MRDVPNAGELVVALPPETEKINEANIIKHPIFRRLEKNKNQADRITRQLLNCQPINIDLNLPALMSPTSLPALMPPSSLRPPASVDTSTIRRLPWIDFTTILENTDLHQREQVIFDILQNNLPSSGDDIYYIYQDPETNFFIIRTDQSAEEIQDFIESILIIDAQLKVQTLSTKKRSKLLRKRKLKIKELRKTYNAHSAADVLDKKLSESKKKELEEEIVKIMRKLNSENDRYYFELNEETQEYEIRLEENNLLLHDVVASIIKITNKIEDVNTPQTEILESMIEKESLLRWSKSKGADELAEELR